jgi:hypothetical protein
VDTTTNSQNEDPHARPPSPQTWQTLNRITPEQWNRLTPEQFERNAQVFARLREVDRKYEKEDKSEVEGKGKGRDDSKEVATDSTPEMTPSTPKMTPSTPKTTPTTLWTPRAEASARETASRFSESTPEQSPSFVAPNRTYADALSPRRPSSAIRRRPNFGSLPQDE